MKLLLLNPNTTTSITERLSCAAQEVCGPDTEICADQVPFGPPIITTETDELAAQIAVLDYLDHHIGGYDGAIIGCFGDPGVQLSKRRYPVPILGIAESAYYMACLHGGMFSVISTGGAEESDLTRNMIERCGLIHRCRGVHPLGVELDKISEASLPQISAVVQQILDQDKCGNIVLACAALVGMGKPLTDQFGVSVFDGVQQAVVLLEGMLRKNSSVDVPQPHWETGFLPLPFSLSPPEKEVLE